MTRKPGGERVLSRWLKVAPQPVFLLDSQGRIRFVNSKLEQWLGVVAEKLIGQRAVFGGDPAEGFGRHLLAPPPELAERKFLRRPLPRLGGETLRDHALFIALEKEAGEAGGTLGIIFTGETAGAEAAEPSVLHARLQELALQLGARRTSPALLGDSPAARRLRDQVRAAGDARTRVLILGRRGSGAESVARAIFPAVRSAVGGVLVPVACPLVDAESLQSLTAGFLRRRNEPSETRPSAMLLLEIDRLSAPAQQELAGFLQLPNVEFPLIATAARSPAKLAARGRFRADLAERLSVLVIRLPRLRARRDDLPLLAQHFLEEFAVSEGLPRSGFTPRAIDELVGYEWPGELDELREVVHAAAQTAKSALVDVADLPEKLRHAASAAARPPRADEPIVLDDFLANIEKEVIRRALARSRGNKSKAAELLGVNRNRLLRRLTQLGLVGAGEEIVFEPLPEESADGS